MIVKWLTILPIAFIFIFALTSQYLALISVNSISDSLQEYLFKNQIQFSRTFSQILSQQLNFEIQKYSQSIYLANNYLSKIINGRVIFKDPHIHTFLEVNLKFNGQGDPVLLSLYQQRPLLTNNWYHQNITEITLLDDRGQQIIRNASRYYLLQRAMEYENLISAKNNRKLKFLNAQTVYQYQGIQTSSPLNNTVANLTTPGCDIGLYPYDPRCRYWYQNTLNFESQIFIQPGVVQSTGAPGISSFDCQKLWRYNETSRSKEIYSVLCFGIQLISIQNYFENLVKTTKQFYFIEPQSKTIVYNSNKIQNLYSVTIDTLDDIELKHLQSEEDAQRLNNTINQYFTSWINSTISNISLNTSAIIQPQDILIPYNRNGSQTTVILTPVVTYEKIPYYEGYENWIDLNKGRYYVEIPYLSINILSDQDLRVESEKVRSFFHSYFIIVSSILTISGFISTIFTYYYSRQIRNMFYSSIESLTQVLRELNDESVRDTIFSIETEELFLSSEASELFNSFKGIYLKLLSISENFFSDNIANTLFRLNRNIKFFKQFENTEAVGITLNNLGSIFLSQCHYFQALQCFSESIIYAKYQIQQFCEKYPESVSAELMKEHSFDNDKKKSIITQDYEVRESNSLSIRPQTSQKSKLSLNSNNQQTQNVISQQNTNIIHSKGLSDRKTDINFHKLNITKDEFYEQRIELLSNLYFRKKNYVIALTAYQENSDYLLHEIEDKQMKKKKFYENNNNSLIDNHEQNKTEKQNMDQSTNVNFQANNFWSEIKQCVYELQLIVKQLPFWESQVIELYLKISKCEQNLDQYDMADEIMQKCEHQLSKFQFHEIQKLKIEDVISGSLSGEDQSQKKENESMSNLDIILNCNSLKNSSKNRNRYTSQIEKKQKQSLNLNQTKRRETLGNQENDYNVYKRSESNNRNQRISKTKSQENQSRNTLGDHQEHKKITDIEEAFSHQRRIDKLIHDTQTLKNIFSSDRIGSLIKLTKAEQLMRKDKQIEAAFELTALLEQKKVLPSHFPFRIFRHLQLNFQKLNAPCKALNSIKRKFNPQLSLQIAMIITCSENQQWILKVVRFLSNLISNILTGKKDQIGITVADWQESCIQTYMTPINSGFIRNSLANVINSVIQLALKRDSISSLKDLIEVSQNENQQQEQEDQLIQDCNIKFSYITHNTKYEHRELSPLLSPQSKDISQQCQFDNENNPMIEEKQMTNIINFYKQKYPQHNKAPPSFYKDYSCSSYQKHQSPQDSFLSKPLRYQDQRFDSRQEEQSFEINQKLKNTQIKLTQPLEQHQGDQDNNNDTLFINQTEISQSKNLITSVDSENKDQKINQLFHLCLRKILSEYSIFQGLEKGLNNYGNPQKEQNFESQEEAIVNHIENNIVLSVDQKKFIIFTTERISFKQNYLFFKMCQILHAYDIVLILLVMEKSTNFLESSSNQGYAYHHKEIIVIFYQIEQIESYLSNQRDRFYKIEYPTFIQYF